MFRGLNSNSFPRNTPVTGYGLEALATKSFPVTLRKKNMIVFPFSQNKIVDDIILLRILFHYFPIKHSQSDHPRKKQRGQGAQ